MSERAAGGAGGGAAAAPAAAAPFPEISAPMNVKHLVHVEWDASKGTFVGLPWSTDEANASGGSGDAASGKRSLFVRLRRGLGALGGDARGRDRDNILSSTPSRAGAAAEGESKAGSSGAESLEISAP
jgi:hypothetical protein